VAADLVCEQPQHVEGVGVIWLLREDLAIERLGLRKLPGLVVL
jgi:hypothetical protein